jgi:nucleoside-diphosphate-sugar epimerase
VKNILVTGGLGFVGSHLIDQLLLEQSNVVVVDNLQSNVVPPSHFEGRCVVISESLEQAAGKLSVNAGTKFDEIYHLASVVGPAGVLQYAGDIAHSIIATEKVTTELALEHGARLILASTSEVYGQTGTLNEDLNCIVPSNFTVRLEYAAAKLTSEIASLNKAKVTNLFVNVVRPFNIAGPRQLPDGGFVLPRFIAAALAGRPLTVFGDGTQVRAFTDVRDIVSGLLCMMRGENSGLILNLGNPANEIAIRKLAEEVIRLSGSNSTIDLVDPKQLFGPLYEEGIERVPDVSKALATLPWKPKYSLEQTILDTLEFYRARPHLLEGALLQTLA